MNFEVYTKSLNTKDFDVDDEGSLIITGVASTNNKDLTGDIVSNNALKSLARQAKGLNLHLDHNHDYEGGIGKIINAYLEGNKLIIEAKILPEYSEDIKKRLEFGMNFGFSIGGKPVPNRTNPNVIDDFELYEISLTLFPANWDTYSTVEMEGVVKSNCISGACNYILTKNYGDKMPNENIQNKEPITEDKVVAIVNEAFLNKKTELLEAVKEMLPVVVEETLDELLNLPSEKAMEPNPNAKADEEAGEKHPQTRVENMEDKACGCAEEEKSVTEPARDGRVESENDNNAPANSEPVPAYQNEQPAISEKSMDELANGVANKVLEIISTKKQRASKLETYKSLKLENPEVKQSKFLDNNNRDKFGRNTDYL